jgi:hypothetical protein
MFLKYKFCLPNSSEPFSILLGLLVMRSHIIFATLDLSWNFSLAKNLSLQDAPQEWQHNHSAPSQPATATFFELKISTVEYLSNY